MKPKTLKKFLNSNEYQSMKKQYEHNYFKVLGSYYRVDGSDLTSLPANRLKEEFKNKVITLKFTNEDDEEVEIAQSFYDVWSCDPMMTEYTDITFECDLSQVSKSTYNLFKGFKYCDTQDSRDIDLSFILDHFKCLCGYNEDQYKYYMSWLAQMVQQPHILPHTCMVFISAEGVGKDTTHNFIAGTLNPVYCLLTEKLEKVCGKFNSAIGGKIFVTINETNPVETRERLENIKSMITAEKTLIEKKGKDPVEVNSFSRFQFFSNRLTAFPVEDGARRPVIVQSSNKWLPDVIGFNKSVEHFTKLRAQMKDGRYQNAFLGYLLRMDISNWNPRNIPKSALHKELEENSQPPLVSFLADLLKNHLTSEVTKMNATDCFNHFTKHLENKGQKYQYSLTKFGVELTINYGVEKTKSSSIYYFFHRSKLQEILEKKYGYSFEKITPEDPKDILIQKLQQQVKDIEALQKKQQIESMRKDIEWMKLSQKILHNHKPKSKFPTLKLQPKKEIQLWFDNNDSSSEEDDDSEEEIESVDMNNVFQEINDFFN